MENESSNLKAGELDLINSYTRRTLKEDEVYAFSVVLCDNETDRDFERFSDSALKKLEKLFVGVTGVLDHDPKSNNQTARIFSCSAQEVSGKKTLDGRQYIRLSARAYMPRTESNRDFIMQLDSGIKKEVSVGCSIAKRICSICGCENGSCGHIRGRSYDGEVCYKILDEPTDAYEWSFVAIPAQRAAGVIKSYNKGENGVDIEERLFSGEAESFTVDEMNVIAEKFRMLQEKAADGEVYRRRLEADINKLVAFSLPQLKRDVLDFITSKMNAAQLENLKKALSERRENNTPIKPQLVAAVKNTGTDNNAFKNI